MLSLRGGGKKKAKHRKIGSKQLIRRPILSSHFVTMRNSPIRSKSKSSSPPKRSSPVRSSKSRSMSGTKAALVLSALVQAASQGSYTAPTEFFLDKVAGCTSHTSVCYKRIESATISKFPSMSAKQKMELSWAKDQVRHEHFRKRELPGRKPKSSNGVKMSKIKNQLVSAGLWGIAGLTTATVVKSVLSRPARTRVGPSLPALGYSHYGPWKQ